jgi:hypothetical protein
MRTVAMDGFAEAMPGAVKNVGAVPGAFDDGARGAIEFEAADITTRAGGVLYHLNCRITSVTRHC